MTIKASFQLSHFQAHNKGLKCRSKCAHCQKAWRETETQKVHLLEAVLQKDEKTVVVISYICDSCKEKVKTQSKT